ncbi:hypothetical protein ASPZODRAFT_136940 [Penicilliopsis zonata CBS 506.65]|uniref:Apple domain-containing protein n=1 Tax=Penicilliopsis zonata CBS 506.65 TaxID=1073090 RepID=A0A1L9S6Q1_9EURO|nr:hypothetical protein ASPZODRAFT_136940 [Penicilliopsis zonata CBS 506.65]OJJ42813.1 hypothetical protein ASPZODRAFT_136940 [Penicilliopsis zonata CBS 506.65]
MKITLALLFALAEAIEVIPPARVALTTITATSVDIVTSTATTAVAVTSSLPSCTVGSAEPTAASCVPSLWSSGSLFYSQRCSSNYVGDGSLLSVLPEVPFTSCRDLCIASTSCAGFNYLGIITYCELTWGTALTWNTAGASYDQAMLKYTTNPCEIITSSTETVVDTFTTTYTTVYVETISTSAISSSAISSSAISSSAISSSTISSSSAISTSAAISSSSATASSAVSSANHTMTDTVVVYSLTSTIYTTDISTVYDCE